MDICVAHRGSRTTARLPHRLRPAPWRGATPGAGSEILTVGLLNNSLPGELRNLTKLTESIRGLLLRGSRDRRPAMRVCIVFPGSAVVETHFLLRGAFGAAFGRHAGPCLTFGQPLAGLRPASGRPPAGLPPAGRLVAKTVFRISQLQTGAKGNRKKLSEKP